MNPAVIIPVSLFASIFGVFYLFFSTRNRERLALIEKGENASIFKIRADKASPIWKVMLLNLGILLIAIGIGIFTGNFLAEATSLQIEVAMPASLFILCGLAMLLGFYFTKKLKL